MFKKVLLAVVLALSFVSAISVTASHAAADLRSLPLGQLRLIVQPGVA